MSTRTDIVSAVLSAFRPTSRRPQALDPQSLVDGVQDRFDDLFLTDADVRDGGDSLMLTFVPDPEDFVITQEGRYTQRAFTRRDHAYIQGKFKDLLDQFARRRGYYVALYQLEEEVNRISAKDVPKRQVAPSASYTEVLWVDLQPFYPSDHYNPYRLIEDGHPYLYHLTDQANLASIKSKGLTPRSSQGNSDHPFSYPDRVYLFKDRQELTHAIKQFVPYPDNPYPDIRLTTTNDIAIIMVDATELRPGTKFYPDTSYPGDGAVFTYTHIPKSAFARVIKRTV